jgi:hypothetical protein
MSGIKREKILAPCSPNNDPSNVDVGLLIERLLLFDKFIMETRRLHELPVLCKIIGLDDTIRILNSGALQFHFNPRPVACINTCSGYFKGAHGLDIIPGIDFRYTNLTYRDKILSDNLSQTITKLELKGRKARLLHELVSEKIIPPISDEGRIAQGIITETIYSDIGLVKKGMAKTIKAKIGIIINPDEFEMSVHQDEKGAVFTTDLMQKLNIDETTMRDILSRGSFLASPLAHGLEILKLHNAAIDLSPNDLIMANTTNAILLGDTTPYVTRLRRLLKLANLITPSEPGINPHFNIRKLIQIRKTPECKAFRELVIDSNSKSDEELLDYFSDIRARAGSFVAWDWLKYLGYLPLPYRLALPSTILLKLKNRFFPVDEARLFLDKQYPSIFNKDEFYSFNGKS